MLLIAVFVVVIITVYQEHKTEKTLEALRDLSSPRALVIRDGVQKRIAGREVVRGDIMILREGDRVPADASILETNNLLVDESLLTGESVAVRKTVLSGEVEEVRPGGEDLPFVYSGTLIVSGHAVARVDKTGVHTEIGKIGKSLGSITTEQTLLHKETSRVVRTIAVIAVVLCIVVVVLSTLATGNLLESFLSGLTLAMALLPEEFPVVLAIFLTLGAWRISKRHVLTRRSAAIETLGAATVLCTDKTGTLTHNSMRLSRLYLGNASYEIRNDALAEIPEEYQQLLSYSVLASQKEPYDAMEKELRRVCEGRSEHHEHLVDRFKFVKEYPITPECLAVTRVWSDSEHGGPCTVAVKGAPEAVANLCHLPDEERRVILETVEHMSSTGLRVLAVAQATCDAEALPEHQQEFTYTYIGLVGFIDPPRETAPRAVEEAYGAGMRVIMITGDYPGTAQYIGQQIGIRDTESYLTGEDLANLPPAELQERIKTVNIFARVLPEQKLLIVNALKANGDIVAMTGDGVNDAPALKAAHIGIAMGERGTDVAREASALILLDDDFSSIVAAVRLGRRIYGNLKRSMGYIIAIHVPIAGMSVLPLVFGLPAVLLPAHIAFLELIIDPACSTVFESQRGARDLMRRKPRDLNHSMFSLRAVTLSVIQGLGVLVVTFITYHYAITSGRSEELARSFVFSLLVLSNLMLIVTNLSWERSVVSSFFSGNKTLYVVTTAALVCLGVVFYVPFFAELFHVVALPVIDIFLVVGIAVVSVVWFELVKLYLHPHMREHY